MGNEWRKTQLQDIVTLLGDGLHGTPEYKDDGEYHFINGNNLENGRIVFKNKTKRVAHSQFLKYQKNLNNRTLLVSINGTIGNVAYYNGEKVVLGKSACYFNLINGVDKRYVRYVLSGHHFLSYINSYATGTTIKNVSLKSMREFSFELPPLPEQKAIAHILGALDARIELNRRMNEALESMAQALFKSWFADFDPVIDNVLASGKDIPESLRDRAKARAALGDKRQPLPEEIRTLFPDEFIDSVELGWIPKGWEVKPFGDLIKETIGGDWGKENEDEKHTIKASIIRGTDIPHLKTGSLSAAPSRWVEMKKLKTRQLDDGDIVIEVSGGSPKQPTGRALYVTNNLIARLGNTIEPASFCRKLRPNTKSEGLFAAIHLDRIYGLGKMWGYQNQSTGISNFQTKIFLSNEMVITPGKSDILDYFYEQVRPLMDKATSNQQIALANLRDTLLPKLLSGEVRIPEAEKMVEGLAG
jgi:type I restriction enzyme S subunit